MSKRTEQVSSVVKHETATALSALLPAELLITVTSVDVSPDLKQATVWVSVIGDDADGAMARVAEVRREVQQSVNRRMTTKFVPKLRFELDRGGEYADRINRVLKNL